MLDVEMDIEGWETGGRHVDTALLPGDHIVVW